LSKLAVWWLRLGIGIERIKPGHPQQNGRHERMHLTLEERSHQAGFCRQAVGIKEIHDDIWLVSFMDYDLGYFDLDTRVLEPLDNPFGPRLSPM
jgi:hypothetical protein